MEHGAQASKQSLCYNTTICSFWIRYDDDDSDDDDNFPFLKCTCRMKNIVIYKAFASWRLRLQSNL